MRPTLPVLLLAAAAATPLPTLAQAATGTVPLGLVLPADGPRAEVAAAIRAGAEAAIRDANREGGFAGRPFELRIVEEDGLWGQGLSRVVGLVFEDGVWGVIGGLDGRSAHLIQQVITKARIPLIIPWAGDATLSRGMVPWSFQVVPDDRQQAGALVRAVHRGGGGRLIAVADTSYDSRRFTEAVRHAAGMAGVDIEVRTAALPEARAAGSGHGASPLPDPVILSLEPSPAAEAIRVLGARARPPALYLPLRLGVPPVLDALDDYPAPVRFPGVQPTESFRAISSLATALGYDAVVALVAAIREAGLDPWRIRDALAVGLVTGRTGPIRFDDRGRRVTPPVVRPAAALADEEEGHLPCRGTSALWKSSGVT